MKGNLCRKKPASTDSITSKVFGKGGTRAALTVLGKGSLLKKAPFPGVSNFSSVSALVRGCGSDGKALGGPAGRRRRTGDLGEEGLCQYTSPGNACLYNMGNTGSAAPAERVLYTHAASGTVNPASQHPAPRVTGPQRLGKPEAASWTKALRACYRQEVLIFPRRSICWIIPNIL